MHHANGAQFILSPLCGLAALRMHRFNAFLMRKNKYANRFTIIILGLHSARDNTLCKVFAAGRMKTSSGVQPELAEGLTHWQHVSALSPVLWWNTKGSWHAEKKLGDPTLPGFFDRASSCCCCGGEGCWEELDVTFQNANAQKLTKRTEIQQTHGKIFKRT